MSLRKCQPFVHIYHCVYYSSAELQDEIKTHNTLKHEGAASTLLVAFKGSTHFNICLAAKQLAPCTALYSVWYCWHLSLLSWTVSKFVTALFCFFNMLFMFLSRFVRCFLFWVFCVLVLLVYCFSFCIYRVSLYYFRISLPTAPTGWKPKCSK